MVYVVLRRFGPGEISSFAPRAQSIATSIHCPQTLLSSRTASSASVKLMALASAGIPTTQPSLDIALTLLELVLSLRFLLMADLLVQRIRQLLNPVTLFILV